MAWPMDWDRGAVLGAIEEASGAVLHTDDPLPDTLIAHAQRLRLAPIDLKLWIYDLPAHAWTTQHLARWAALMGFPAARIEAESDSTDEIPGGDDGVQEVRR